MGLAGGPAVRYALALGMVTVVFARTRSGVVWKAPLPAVGRWHDQAEQPGDECRGWAVPRCRTGRAVVPESCRRTATGSPATGSSTTTASALSSLSGAQTCTQTEDFVRLARQAFVRNQEFEAAFIEGYRPTHANRRNG